jgi:hypothetical protein
LTGKCPASPALWAGIFTIVKRKSLICKILEMPELDTHPRRMQWICDGLEIFFYVCIVTIKEGSIWMGAKLSIQETSRNVWNFMVIPARDSPSVFGLPELSWSD